ncbi:hypothetical protein DFJ74DRAFT_134342 [Hyaloraphidium curvatum]|nr:hypothetical protein DFJ74DRAFT_134342 [Hyaloraphidium curvatum]
MVRRTSARSRSSVSRLSPSPSRQGRRDRPLASTMATNTYNARNLVGYGENAPDPKWPGGAKVCVSFVVNYEEGGESSIEEGDKGPEFILHENPRSAPQRGIRDINVETQYEYGSRAGVWRLLRLFKSRGMKFCGYIVARAAERNPEAIKAMVRDGHEVASHHYRWINYQRLPEAVHREHIRKVVETLRSIAGYAPIGWYAGRITPESRRWLVEEYEKMGLPLAWDSDFYNDDLPFYEKFSLPSGDRWSLIIPYSWSNNDAKFVLPTMGFADPRGYFEHLKMALDQLLEEGRAGHPRMMSIGLHCRIVGHPARARALAEFMDYIKSLGSEVWVATRAEIAAHWRSVHPPPPGAKDAGEGVGPIPGQVKANL